MLNKSLGNFFANWRNEHLFVNVQEWMDRCTKQLNDERSAHVKEVTSISNACADKVNNAQESLRMEQANNSQILVGKERIIEDLKMRLDTAETRLKNSEVINQTLQTKLDEALAKVPVRDAKGRLMKRPVAATV